MVNLKSKLKQVQKQRGALLVMNLVIIALCLVLFWGTIHMFRQLNDAFSRPAKTNWMENKVQNENYAYLLVNYHEDMVSEVGLTQSLSGSSFNPPWVTHATSGAKPST